MEFSVLTGERLLSLRLMSVGTHPAWVDSSTPQIATYAANLELAGEARCVQVCPCEVEMPGKYPALGIELRDWPAAPGIQRWDGGEYAVATPEKLSSFYLPPLRMFGFGIRWVTVPFQLLISFSVVAPPLRLGTSFDDAWTGCAYRGPP